MNAITHKKPRRNLGLMALEPRWMFDGAAAGDVAEQAGAAPDAPPAAETREPVVVREVDPAANDGRKEAVFIDTSLADYQTLIDAVKDGVEIVLIDGAESGLAQMVLWAETRAGFDAISILSHGGEARLHLGSDTVDQNSLSNAAIQADLARIGSALTAGGDLLLYGCDIAKGVSGQAFIEALAGLTGADVAASDDMTGSSAWGGDWDLEVRVGHIETQTLEFQAYAYFLPTASATFVLPGGEGSGSASVTYDYNSGGDATRAIQHATLTADQNMTAGGGSITVSGLQPGQHNWTVTWFGQFNTLRTVTGAGNGTTTGFWDIGGTSTTWTFTVEAAPPPPNQAPSATATTVNFNEGGTGSVNLHTLVSDDNDADGAMTYAKVSGTGTVSGNTASYSAPANPALKGAHDYSLTYRVTDTGNLSSTATITWRVTYADDPITSTDISDQTFNSTGDWSYNTSGHFVDVDDAETYSASLADGGALPSWLSFNTSTGVLSGNPPGGEANNSYEIRITGTSPSGSVSENFMLNIGADVNDLPTDISLSNNSIAENSAADAMVGNLSTTDEDDSEAHTYTLVGGAIDKFVISGNQLRVAAGANLDFETDTSHSLTIRTTDSGGATFDRAFTINITDVNEAPTDIALSNVSVAENSAGGTVIGTLSATDQDANPVHTYSIPAGSSLFEIVGDELRVKNGAGLDYEMATSHTVTIRVNDGVNNFDKAFSVSVTNVEDPPTVTTNTGLLVTQGQSGVITAARLVATDGEQGAAALTYTIGTAPAAGTLFRDGVALNAGGNFTQADINAGLLSYTNGGGVGVADSFTFSVDDGVSGSTALATFAITVNRNPAGSIADQGWNGSGAKSYQFGVFTDADGDALTYSATQVGGAALPSWLSFDANTRTFSGNPPASLSSIALRVTANDGRGGTVSDDFTITLTNVNDPVIVANPIADQTWTGSGSHSFEVPANSFSDPDGDVLTYSTSALPSWLSFDATTRTFSGNPPSGIAHMDITVTAADGNGSDVADTFRLNLVDANDAPVIAAANPTADIGRGGSVALPPGTFFDADNDTLTYTATDIPGWLSFDAATRTFSGIPPQGPAGSVAMTVTAHDPSGVSVSTTFTVAYNNPPPAAPPAPRPAPPPVVEAPRPVAFAEASPVLMTSIRAAVSDGGIFSQGIQGDANAARASAPMTSGGGFQVSLSTPSVNAARDGALFVQKGIPSVIADMGRGISFTVPADAFGHTNADASVQLTAKLVDGRPLPPWMSFDSTRGSFVGVAPQGFDGSLSVIVVARDSAGNEVATTFQIQLSGGIPIDGEASGDERGADAAPLREGAATDTAKGKPAFTMQMKLAGREAAYIRNAALAAQASL